MMTEAKQRHQRTTRPKWTARTIVVEDTQPAKTTAVVVVTTVVLTVS